MPIRKSKLVSQATAENLVSVGGVSLKKVLAKDVEIDTMIYLPNEKRFFMVFDIEFDLKCKCETDEDDNELCHCPENKIIFIQEAIYDIKPDPLVDEEISFGVFDEILEITMSTPNEILQVVDKFEHPSKYKED